MELIKSLDPYRQIIAALLNDAQALHSEVFSPTACRLSLQKIESRLAVEGISLLTKTLPRLGKSLDRALSSTVPLDSTGFEKIPGGQLPRFLGELFERVFRQDGWILPTPDVTCIDTIRQILFVFYKLELPYSDSEESKVICQFEKTECDIERIDNVLSQVAQYAEGNPAYFDQVTPGWASGIIRRARILLSKVFAGFDPSDIRPRHGPGAVSTREKLWHKYRFERINPRLDALYPFDAYFMASPGHVCDAYKDIQSLQVCESSARVCLVPKDSRGPRLISCEPLEFQWIQQGLGQAIVEHVESHPLTRYCIHFTDQQPNQFGALLGSKTGQYATLDLKEASDRVTVGLVKALFPEPLLAALLAARSESTILPSGKVLKLRKFAPMGSALCFPVLALSIWAILSAGLVDADSLRQPLEKLQERLEGVLVYGDDVIVPTAKAESAIMWLESLGLLVNRDKSYYQGSFRESCGVDSYQGYDVTPTRIKSPWSSKPHPKVYVSWIAYANDFRRRGWVNVSDVITDALCSVYTEIPQTDMWPGMTTRLTEAGRLKYRIDGEPPVPSLDYVPEEHRPTRRRMQPDIEGKPFYGELQWRVRDVVSRPISKEIPGWLMLLRHFAESNRPEPPLPWVGNNSGRSAQDEVKLFGITDQLPYSVRKYTRRETNKIVWRWR